MFYKTERLQSHLDEVARNEIANLYHLLLQPGCRILDLMSSWQSHLPGSLESSRVTGLGMNMKEMEIEGLKAYSTVLDVPFNIDIATIYVPPEIGEKIVEEVAKRNIPEIWINPGAESSLLIKRAEDLGLQTVLGCSLVAIGQDLE